jgi:hypothetical protein
LTGEDKSGGDWGNRKQPVAAFRMLALVAAVCLLRLDSQVPRRDGAEVEPGVPTAKWNHGGRKCMEEPEWEIEECKA